MYILKKKYYHCQIVWNSTNASRNLFLIKNKVFSFNFDISNPNPISYLGNVQWKVVKQMEINIWIILTIVVPSLATCFNFPIQPLKCFPSVIAGQIQINQHSQARFSGSGLTIEHLWFLQFFNVNLFEMLQTFEGICFTYRIECSSFNYGMANPNS